MALVAQPHGHYKFLATSVGAPFSAGAVAEPNYAIVHATLHKPLPWKEGFAAIAAHLAAHNRPKAALCAVELRCPEPYTSEAFAAFNKEYLALLTEWGILVDGLSPAARSNIAAEVHAPTEQTLYAFSYTVPRKDAPKCFVISGAGERPTVRPGETSIEALKEKTLDIMATMQRRLTEVGGDWSDVTDVNMYTVHRLHGFLEDALLAPIGVAALHGIHWHYGRPPVIGLEVEVDIRATEELRFGR